MDGFWVFVIVLVLIQAFTSVVNGSFDRQEIGECHKWQTWATEYKDFYLTSWQSDQCAAHNITVDAPVRK